MTVYGCAVRSSLTGCQVTSRLLDRFSRYSKWLDTFRTALARHGLLTTQTNVAIHEGTWKIRHAGFSAITAVCKVMDLGWRVHSDWLTFQIETHAIGFQHFGPPRCILSPPTSSRSPEIPVHNASHLTPRKLLVCSRVSIPVASRS